MHKLQVNLYLKINYWVTLIGLKKAETYRYRLKKQTYFSAAPTMVVEISLLLQIVLKRQPDQLRFF